LRIQKKRQTNRSDEAHLDIAARGVWVTGQKAFFDVRVFNSLVTTPAYWRSNTLLFTPLVFSATGGASRKCKKALRRMVEMLKGNSYSDTILWTKN